MRVFFIFPSVSMRHLCRLYSIICTHTHVHAWKERQRWRIAVDSWFHRCVFVGFRFLPLSLTHTYVTNEAFFYTEIYGGHSILSYFHFRIWLYFFVYCMYRVRVQLNVCAYSVWHTVFKYTTNLALLVKIDGRIEYLYNEAVYSCKTSIARARLEHERVKATTNKKINQNWSSFLSVFFF